MPTPYKHLASGETYFIPDAYFPGSTIGPVEAAELNQLRAHQIRSAFLPKIDSLPPSKIQDHINELSASFSLNSSKRYSKARDLQEEAKKVAKELYGELGEEELETILTSKTILDIAEKRLSARQELARSTLAELLDD